MIELHTKYQIAQLISKEIVGNMSSEEKEKLQNWIDESEENLKLYEKIKKGESRQIRSDFVNGLDVKSAWQKVGAGIEPQRKTFKLWEWGLRVAAVLVIGAFIGTLYHISTRTLDLTAKLEVIQIEPGSSKAVLQLHNGETLHLEDENNDSIVEKDGTLISNKEGLLAYATQADAADQILYNTVKVPIGGEYQLTLADGTKVWLNSDSQIKYPVQFNQEKRKVWIDGEVYFDVAHDKNKAFVVDVKDVEIEVLGTEFNIEAYHDQKSVTTTLVEGSVKLRKDSESVILEPNQQAIISEGEKQFAVNHVIARNYALWKDGIFFFEEASIENIMEKLERWYGLKVFYMNPSVKEKRFSIEVKRYESIDKVLDILSRTNKVHFDVKSNAVTVRK
ncbi:DUF4974 domain-containing protein [Ancylomarina sp. DW003]|nr:FecR domain-containing protein [Ancylomarina sp. DW003]MDE5422720.1 DUF4974 domain-containing protein [Ancylomarina sp. DW003]